MTGDRAVVIGIDGGGTNTRVFCADLSGNLRGMDHLADVLNYLKITVHPNKLPISVVNSIVSPEGKIIDDNTLKAIDQQLDEFISWGSFKLPTGSYGQTLNFKP